MSHYNKYIGQRLKVLREEGWLSAEQVASTLGVSLEIYLESEMGLRRIPVSEIFAVRKLLNISIEDFFTFDGQYIPDLDYDIACSDVPDLIHYFSNVQDPDKRRFFIDEIRDASSVF